MSKSVLFLVPYPAKTAPSQRFRVELYEPILREHGIKYDIACFMDAQTWKIIFSKGHHLQKIAGILKGYVRRFVHLTKAVRYDYIFIHREAAPLGPPVFEWMLAKILRKKIIYDFDDAIWIPNVSASNKVASWLKAFWKVKYICRWSSVVTGGNEYLNSYAKQHGARKTIFLPTCVDVVHGHRFIKQHGDHKPVVGWTGSHSTLFYLNDIMPVLRDLQEVLDFTFLVIADKSPNLYLKDWKFVRWNEATEVEDLLHMDIGIMPLRADAWSEGKCGFKLIQYLSCGIPAIADPIGVNKDIVEDGRNGFLCQTCEEWEKKLRFLLTNWEQRKEFGSNGRKKIVNAYSIQSQEEKFLSLFR